MNLTQVFQSPADFHKGFRIRMAVYGYNGVGKTYFAGHTGLRTLYLACRDAGTMSLRDTQNVKIAQIGDVDDYLEVITSLTAKKVKADLLVVDTVTGLMSTAIKSVKVRRDYSMNWKKWGKVTSMLIECISETEKFDGDLIYLIQEKKRRSIGDDESESVPDIRMSITPGVREYLNSAVDWIGRLYLAEDGNGGVERRMDFRPHESTDTKDRSGLFPKVIRKPNYPAIRKRILSGITGGSDGQGRSVS